MNPSGGNSLKFNSKCFFTIAGFAFGSGMHPHSGNTKSGHSNATFPAQLEVSPCGGNAANWQSWAKLVWATRIPRNKLKYKIERFMNLVILLNKFVFNTHFKTQLNPIQPKT